jgi:hypothetical protein
MNSGAEQNVGAAARHIGGHRNRPLAAGLRYDVGLALMVFRVQHLVFHAHPLQNPGQPLRFFNGNRADQDRLPLFVSLFDLFRRVPELLLLGPVHHVRVFNPDQGAIGRGDDHVQVVDLLKLGSFGFGGTRHARQLLVHAEVVLKGDGGERLVFPFDLDLFLGLHRLVQAVAPAAAGHQTPRELVNDDDFAVFDDTSRRVRALRGPRPAPTSE